VRPVAQGVGDPPSRKSRESLFSLTLVVLTDIYFDFWTRGVRIKKITSIKEEVLR
jgi:hypothetical protein